jgi:hypothetical protein
MILWLTAKFGGNSWELTTTRFFSLQTFLHSTKLVLLLLEKIDRRLCVLTGTPEKLDDTSAEQLLNFLLMPVPVPDEQGSVADAPVSVE